MSRDFEKAEFKTVVKAIGNGAYVSVPSSMQGKPVLVSIEVIRSGKT